MKLVGPQNESLPNVCMYMYMYCIYKHIDESHRELTAFKILADVMNTTKKSSLGYVYSEYEVCLYACRRLHIYL